MKKFKKMFFWIMADKKRTVAGLFIVALIVFGLIKIFGSKNIQPQYTTAKVEKGNIISTVSASGQMISSNVINITTSALGLVKKVYVKDGQKIYAGQLIAELTQDSDGTQKSAQAYSSYLSAKSTVSSANANIYTLQSKMFAANQKFINDAAARNLNTSDPTYIQEYADWKAAEASYLNQANAVSQAQISLSSAWLSYTSSSPRIVAPMAGTIDNITIVEGMSLSSSTSSLRIAVIRSAGNPIASFNVSEIDVNKIKPGFKATITLDSLAGKTFTGKVVSIDKIGTVTSGVTNYPAIIAFDTSSEDILPNMSASANIIVAVKDNVLLIPSSAVQIQGEQNTVRTLKGKQVQSVNVEVGLSSDSQTEIISGISEGDEIITNIISPSDVSQKSGTSPFGGAGTGGMMRMVR